MDVQGKFDFAKIERAVREGRDRGVALAAEVVMSEARDNAPVDEGTLRRSGRVDEVESSQSMASVVMSFNTPYAAKQHEELGYHHPHGGRPKFLEIAMMRNGETIRKIVATQIRRAL